ncbi:hypothetical protein PFISCL1PPCAC_624, partial [Pristionchus fissidentatus]
EMERTSSSSLLIEEENSNRPGFFRRILNIFDEDETHELDDIQPVSFLQLFRFASRKELFVIVIASIISLLAGFISPIRMFIVGKITTIYVEEKAPLDNDKFLWSVWTWSSLNGIGFIITFIIEFIQHYLHMWATERIMKRCRSTFVDSILSRDSSDIKLSTGELSNRLNSYIDRMRDGI